MAENLEDPAAVIGTPQAAAAEASGVPAPPVRKTLNVNLLKMGERTRNGGLLWPMPEEFGGGQLRIRPAHVTSVGNARDAHELKLRKVPEVRRRFGKNEPLRGKAGTELNRFTFVMCAVEWIDPMPFVMPGGNEVNPADLSEVELRQMLEEVFLPQLDLRSDAEAEDELNMPFLQHVLDGLDEVGRVPAQEIAKVGKDFTLGQSEGTDYSD